MNSDPYDSAAWRSFGMLDADESAIYDEAMRHDPLLRSANHEMDRVSAAIAVATSTPVVPREGQLDRLQARLGLHRAHRAPVWLAVSGWATAASLALLLVFRSGETSSPSHSSESVAAKDAGSASKRPLPVAPAIQTDITKTDPVASPETPKPDSAARPDAVDPEKIRQTVRVETRRLTQEIEVLREHLAKFQERDRVLFEAVPGMALPVIMKMSPPGTDKEPDPTLAASDPVSPVFHLLADNQRSGKTETVTTAPLMNATATTTAGDDDAMDEESVSAPPLPSAIPIYDPARDMGIVQIRNLSPAPEGMTHHLWVKTAGSEQPIHVGSLPNAGSVSSESFDFNLGSNMVLPTGFILTVGNLSQPEAPAAGNTVLQGPPTPPR